MEIDMFLKEPNLPLKNDVYGYWEVNNIKFPYLK